jgi:23S rRNA (pseudouridine1915-N3)-methyltransferase
MPVPLFNINLIAVGKIKDRLLAEKIADFATRLAFDIRLTTHEIKDSDKDTEGKKIVDLVKDQLTHVIALSEEGKEFSSEEFSQYLQKAGRNIHFCIGGPNGLSDQIKKHATALISLSRMTFTHEMARMLLLEQIYRAVSIIKNRGYHR